MEVHAIIDGRLKSGTAQGQVLFWDNTLKRWVNAETSELFWDDTNKRLGIKTASPSSEVDVSGTITVTRILAGGVKE
ncbi:hypothetical protein LCGC14_1141210 [marine sediment metagenome]|uniref:Uncharacterized protein n=1 Tax=marine sediment metagenome TaxID=412755 RepID=A0A0F9ML81_9ZZZZ